MNKLILLSVISVFFMGNILAQTTPSVPNLKKYKIVIQLTNGDTAVHRATVKQIFNALAAAPNSKIEVVCHNNGISFLQTAKTFQGDKIKELKSKSLSSERPGPHLITAVLATPQ